MARMSIDLPDGPFGDIEEALQRAGAGRLESATLAETIIEDGAILQFNSRGARNRSIDPDILAKELRAIGLIVRWGNQGRGTS